MRTALHTAIICLITAFLLSTYLPVLGQSYTWTQKANYGGGETYDPFYFVIGTKAYVGTGKILPSALKNDFWEYDPATDTWTQKSDFPGSGRVGAKGFSIGNYGYAGTGWDPTAKKDFFRYDPSTNNWSAIADFGGTARYTTVAFSIGNKGYMGLGYAPCRSDFWEYDPALDQWAQIASHPNGGRQTANVAVAGDFAYVIGGTCNTTLYNDVYRYDPILNTWTARASFPMSGRGSGFAFAIGDSIYYGMGNNYANNSSSFTIYNDFWKYDINNDSWQQLPNHPGGKRFCGVSFSIGNKGYLGIGSDTIFNTHYLSDFWEYSLTTTGLVEQQSSANKLILYPVPARDMIFLDFSESIKAGDHLNIQCFDLTGKSVISRDVIRDEKRISLDVQNLSPGMYLIRCNKNDELIGASRFVIQ